MRECPNGSGLLARNGVHTQILVDELVCVALNGGQHKIGVVTEAYVAIFPCRGKAEQLIDTIRHA